MVDSDIPLQRRIVEVIAEIAGPRQAGRRFRYGSGCIVVGRIVLTAAHVVAGASAVSVRGVDKMERAIDIDSMYIGDPESLDLALIELVDEVDELPARSIARVDRASADAHVLDADAIGYPLFIESEGGLRETAHVTGVIPASSRLVSGLLSMTVVGNPANLAPSGGKSKSQWEGMSGAPVFSDGHLIGVVTEHSASEGPATVTVTPLTHITSPEWWSRLGVHDPLMMKTLKGSRAGQREAPLASGATSVQDQDLNDLAVSVETWWNAEIRKRNLEHDLIPVSWGGIALEGHNADLGGGVTGSVTDMVGMVNRFLALPEQRLLLVGEPGSGKTATAILMVRKLLERRSQMSEPKVPVFLSLSSWDPKTSLRGWMVRRICAEYMRPSDQPQSENSINQLMENNRIIPVLDGLDELAPTVRGKALQAINMAIGRHPLILTCRTAEYREIAQEAGPLKKAAASHAAAVKLDAALSYLATHGRSSESWQSLQARKDDLPEYVTAVLSNTLLLSLMVEVYGLGELEPDELLDVTRFPDYPSIAGYIYSRIINVYTLAMHVQSGNDSWKADRASKWIGNLAKHLDRSEIYDIVLTQVPQAVNRKQRVVLGVACGLLGAAAAVTVRPLVEGLAIGAGAGLVVGTVIAVITRSSRSGRKSLLPSASGNVKSRLPASPGNKGGGFIRGKGPLHIVAFSGFLGLVLGLIATIAFPAHMQSTYALGVALLSGIGSGFLIGWPGWQPEIAVTQLKTSSPPREQLAAERKNNLIFAGTLICALALAVGLLGWLDGGIVVAALAGASASFVLDKLSMGWWSYAIAMLLLSARRYFPLSLVDFLEASYELNILRRVGGVYQFRHAYLQDYLAGKRQKPESPTLKLL